LSEPTDIFVIRTPEQLKAISDPLRQRLVGAFAEPATIKVVAERIGVPLGRLYHHIDQLEAAGFIRVVSERKRRATVERTFQASARRFTVHASAVGAANDMAAGAALARAAVEELLAGVSDTPAPDGGLHIAQTVLRLTPDALARLERQIGEFLRSFESPDGRETRLLWMAAPKGD
jgi:DNA-binding transcriptional ArsR family regulator